MFEEIKKNYFKIKNEIPKEVTLIAVSKKQGVDKIKTLYDLGQRDFGENYVQELLEKSNVLKNDCPEIVWHFLGRIQKNKIKALLPVCQNLHSLDSIEVLNEITKRKISIRLSKKINVFVQVNIDEEDTKGGVLLKDLSQFLNVISQQEGVCFCGLMCIPRMRGENKIEPFLKILEIEKSLATHRFPGRSMGMSDDYREAIKARSTHIRVGSALFGKRI